MSSTRACPRASTAHRVAHLSSRLSRVARLGVARVDASTSSSSSSRRHQLSRARAGASPAPDASDADADTTDDHPFETFARDVRARPGVDVALKSLSRWDADACLACAYVGGARGRETTRGEVNAIARACARWTDRVSGHLNRARASLASDGSAAARATEARVAACGRDVERLARAGAYAAVVEEERCVLGESYTYSDASTSCVSVDERWRMACANVGAYLELVGATPTVDEWRRLRVVLDGCVARVDGEAHSERLVRDDARWNEMKTVVDDSAVRAKRLTRVENNSRYAAAKRELGEAKEAWREAAAAYKAARRRVKAARHGVHKTRKAVRVEYR